MPMPHSANPVPPLIGHAPAFHQVLDQVSRLAALDRPVLIVGERGTGKELVAARLHYLSRRWDGPLVRVNCGALAETLLDSELFGHEAGAFTGAARRHHGRFVQAQGGTLILDEIGLSSQAVQEKLLRVIEYGEFQPVGGEHPLRCNVRVVASTNADLPALAASGRFRADLLDRLAFDVITLPPLRARPEDIPLLATHFAQAFRPELGITTFAGFSEGAMDTLRRHPWPGNVRELRNAVERSLARAPDPAQPLESVILDPFASPFLPPPSVPAPAPTPTPASGAFQTQLDEVARTLLRTALVDAQYNQKAAAARLGLGYHQFRRLLHRTGVSPAQTEVPADRKSVV